MATINLTIEEAIEHLRKHFHLSQEDEINISDEVVVEEESEIGEDWTENTSKTVVPTSSRRVDIITRRGVLWHNLVVNDVDWSVNGHGMDVVYWRFTK